MGRRRFTLLRPVARFRGPFSLIKEKVLYLFLFFRPSPLPLRSALGISLFFSPGSLSLSILLLFAPFPKGETLVSNLPKNVRPFPSFDQCRWRSLAFFPLGISPGDKVVSSPLSHDSLPRWPFKLAPPCALLVVSLPLPPLLNSPSPEQREKGFLVDPSNSQNL